MNTTANSAVAGELIALLERFAARAPLPRVRALHLPPPQAAQAKVGEFCAVELDDGSIGLSYVLLDQATRQFVAAAGDGESIAGSDALTVARAFAMETGVRRTLGCAAVNALTRCLFERAGFVPPPSSDSIGMLEPIATDRVGMIGFFPPLVKRIAEVGAPLIVVELKQELVGDFPGYRVTLEAGELTGCNKVLATSTLLLNDSLDRMLAHCGSAVRFALIGPSAGCLPDPLFARGVTLLGGTWITDPGAFLDALHAGVAWSGAARKVVIRREDYPGFEALLARI